MQGKSLVLILAFVFHTTLQSNCVTKISFLLVKIEEEKSTQKNVNLTIIVKGPKVIGNCTVDNQCHRIKDPDKKIANADTNLIEHGTRTPMCPRCCYRLWQNGYYFCIWHTCMLVSLFWGLEKTLKYLKKIWVIES